jgi:hypothetical protein
MTIGQRESASIAHAEIRLRACDIRAPVPGRNGYLNEANYSGAPPGGPMSARPSETTRVLRSVTVGVDAGARFARESKAPSPDDQATPTECSCPSRHRTSFDPTTSTKSLRSTRPHLTAHRTSAPCSVSWPATTSRQRFPVHSSLAEKPRRWAHAALRGRLVQPIRLAEPGWDLPSNHS